MRIVIIIFLLIPFASQAGVFKCEVEGKIVYQEIPCQTGDATKLSITSAPSNTTNSNAIGIRESERKWLRERKAEQAKRAKRRRINSARIEADRRSRKADERTCNSYKAQEDYYDDLARVARSQSLKKKHRAKADYYGKLAKPYCK